MYETIKDIGDLDYVVDMELCTCSCSAGQTGAACKHQAAVAKRFKIAKLNTVPIHCKATRQLFATIARGSHYVMEAEFYADLTDTGAKESDLKLLSAAVNTTQNDENAHKDNDIHPDVSDNINTYMYDSEDPWQQLSYLKESLNKITSDTMSRLEETNHNILSGVTKFIRTYNTMKESHSPTTTITYALHNFGRPDSEFSLLLVWPITNCFIH